ncbi:MAG: LPS export ABC transporter periplasmic protein LptC [Treponema sp.]|nr:LPS export ABC transporter periplasmic protein LptC [Treponema sp.]
MKYPQRQKKTTSKNPGRVLKSFLQLFPLSGSSLCVLSAAAVLLAACSFDYGLAAGTDKNKPDIVMENLEYVRVRGGDPLVRFQAEHAERWEERQTMELKNFSFEQLQNHGEDINAQGKGGGASVQLDSGNISLKNGITIDVKSEDLKIRTSGLEWKDKEKTLSGGAEDEVDVERTDGTSFSGKGFSADVRNRTWAFSGEVRGSYVEKNDQAAGEQTGEPAAITGEKQTQTEQQKKVPPPPPPVKITPPLREEK